MLVVALLLALADESSTAPAPPAERPPPEAQLAAGQHALDSLALEDAARLLEDVITNPEASPDLRARAWLALGQTRASLLDESGAEAAFAAALALNGLLQLPGDASPKTAALFDRTRAALSQRELPAVSPQRPAGDDEPAPHPPAAVDVRAPAGGPAALVVLGGVLASGAVFGALGTFAVDRALATPPPGRTRDEHDSLRTLGLASGGVTLALAVAAVAAFVVHGITVDEAPR